MAAWAAADMVNGREERGRGVVEEQKKKREKEIRVPFDLLCWVAEIEWSLKNGERRCRQQRPAGRIRIVVVGTNT